MFLFWNSVNKSKRYTENWKFSHSKETIDPKPFKFIPLGFIMEQRTINKGKDSEYLSLKMDPYMKVNGKMIKCADMEE